MSRHAIIQLAQRASVNRITQRAWCNMCSRRWWVRPEGRLYRRMVVQISFDWEAEYPFWGRRRAYLRGKNRNRLSEYFVRIWYLKLQLNPLAIHAYNFKQRRPWMADKAHSSVNSTCIWISLKWYFLTVDQCAIRPVNKSLHIRTHNHGGIRLRGPDS